MRTDSRILKVLPPTRSQDTEPVSKPPACYAESRQGMRMMATDTPVYEGAELDVLAAMPNYYRWIMETFAPRVRGTVV